MRKLEDYTPSELATLATIIGVSIAPKFNIEQQNVVANLLFGVAQSIFIIAAQNQNLKTQEENQNGSINLGNTNKDLQKQIDKLTRDMKNFKDIDIR